MSKQRLAYANDNAVARQQPLRFLSVCSGIEAASQAWPHWKAVAFSEIEKFPSAMLAHHYPHVPNLGDFTKIDPSTLGRVDILCGGTPCQAFSVAGLRQSLADARGNISLEFVRLAHELAAGNGLRNVVWENVPGVLNTTDNAFGCFLGGLVGADDPIPPPAGRKWSDAGMVAGPKGRVAWRVLDAQYFGLAQRRRRVIVVADFGNGADPAAVLFERASMRGNPPPRREKGEGVAPTISARTKGGGGLGTDFDLDGGLVEAIHKVSHPLLAKGNDSFDESMQSYVLHAPEIARCVATREGSSQDYETTTMVAVGVDYTNGTIQGDISGTLEAAQARGNRGQGVVCVTGDITHALKAEGADASEDGTGRGAPIVAFTSKDYGADAQEDLAPILRAGGHVGSHANGGVGPAIAMTVALRGREGSGTAELGGDVANALRASQGGGDNPHVLTSAVRRLTPRECERLMGFPDDYTLIPYRNKPAADGPRYKALGNSWAVPKFTWLGRRIEQYMPANDNLQQDAA